MPVLTWCFWAGGRVFLCSILLLLILLLLILRDLWLVCLWVGFHPSSRYEAGWVVRVAQRPHDVCDERFLKFGQLWCRSVHVGADGKAQTGLLITLNNARPTFLEKLSRAECMVHISTFIYSNRTESLRPSDMSEYVNMSECYLCQVIWISFT